MPSMEDKYKSVKGKSGNSRGSNSRRGGSPDSSGSRRGGRARTAGQNALIEGFEEEIKDLSSELAKINKAYEKLKKEKSASSEDTDELEALVSAKEELLKKEIKTSGKLREELEEKESRILDLESENEKLSDESLILKEERDNLEAKAEGLEERGQKILSEKLSLEKKLESLEGEESEDLSQHLDRIKVLEDEKKEDSEKISSLERELSRKEDELKELAAKADSESLELDVESSDSTNLAKHDEARDLLELENRKLSEELSLLKEKLTQGESLGGGVQLGAGYHLPAVVTDKLFQKGFKVNALRWAMAIAKLCKRHGCIELDTKALGISAAEIGMEARIFDSKTQYEASSNAVLAGFASNGKEAGDKSNTRPTWTTEITVLD